MRINQLKIITIILFLFLIAGLIRVQLFRNFYYKSLSQENIIRIIPIRASRGNIYDRNGKILAKNRLSFNVAAIPNEVKDNEEVFTILAKILNKPPLTLIKTLNKNTVNPFVPTIIARDISKEKAIIIEEKKMQLRGVIIQTEPLREYLHAESIAHLIGYVNELNKDELKRLKSYGYKPLDLIGRTGIEKALNSYLKGKDGGYQVQTDSRGRQIDILGYKKPIKGKSIYLTIDIDLQDYIYGLVKDKKAAVVVWNPNNGSILSLVSSPSFDPNIFINPDNKKNKIIKDIFSSKLYPMVNRNIQAEYPIGSLFKIVTAIAALETNSIDKNQTFNCPGSFKLGGRVFRCWEKSGHGNLNIIGALKHSCNVFFYKTGVRVGVDNLSKYARRFGFGRRTGISLPYEAEGLVPSRQWKLKTKAENWYEGETVIFSIGQGYLLTTPLQALRMISVIANGGYLVYPQITEKIGNVETGSRAPTDLGFSSENINIVKKGLEEAVSNNATGARAQVRGISIAGKTATAQVTSGSAHAWFVCFFPSDKPKYAMVVFIEHGGSGGFEAAPLAKKIIIFIKENYI